MKATINDLLWIEYDNGYAKTYAGTQLIHIAWYNKIEEYIAWVKKRWPDCSSKK